MKKSNKPMMKDEMSKSKPMKPSFKKMEKGAKNRGNKMKDCG